MAQNGLLCSVVLFRNYSLAPIICINFWYINYFINWDDRRRMKSRRKFLICFQLPSAHEKPASLKFLLELQKYFFAFLVCSQSVVMFVSNLMRYAAECLLTSHGNCSSCHFVFTGCCIILHDVLWNKNKHKNKNKIWFLNLELKPVMQKWKQLHCVVSYTYICTCSLPLHIGF